MKLSPDRTVLNLRGQGTGAGILYGRRHTGTGAFTRRPPTDRAGAVAPVCLDGPHNLWNEHTREDNGNGTERHATGDESRDERDGTR